MDSSVSEELPPGVYSGDEEEEEAVFEDFRLLYSERYPPMVRVSCYDEGDDETPSAEIGFITESDGTSATVVGRAYLFYGDHKPAGSVRGLLSGEIKITVSLNADMWNESYPAVLVHMDYDNGIAVLKFNCSKKLPTVKLGSSTGLSNDQQIWGIFMSYSHALFGGARTILDVDCGVNGEDCFHTDDDLGLGKIFVYFNHREKSDCQLIGVTSFECPKCPDCVHGVRVEVVKVILEQTKDLSADIRPSITQTETNVLAPSPAGDSKMEGDIAFLKAEINILCEQVQDLKRGLNDIPMGFQASQNHMKAFMEYMKMEFDSLRQLLQSTVAAQPQADLKEGISQQAEESDGTDAAPVVSKKMKMTET